VSNHSIFLYDGPVRELIQQYKFKSQSRLVYLWAYFFAHYLRHHWPAAVVVPVPGRRSSVRRRGWDQMYRLGGVLKKEYGITVLFLLDRRGGSSQKTLSYEGRLHNLKGRISLKYSVKRSMKTGYFEMPDQIVLIDDIFTTGATLSECAHVLSEKGAKRVRALTIGRAPY